MERYCEYERGVNEAWRRLADILIPGDNERNIEFLNERINHLYESLGSIETTGHQLENGSIGMQAASELAEMIINDSDDINYVDVYASMIEGDDIWLNARIINTIMSRKKAIVEGQKSRYESLQSSDDLSDEDVMFLKEYSTAIDQIYALMKCMRVNYNKASIELGMDEWSNMKSFEWYSDEDLMEFDEMAHEVEGVVERLLGLNRD